MKGLFLNLIFLLGTHNIAPYKSKGIERAAALNAKADESDKCLPLDFGKAGKIG